MMAGGVVREWEEEVMNWVVWGREGKGGGKGEEGWGEEEEGEGMAAGAKGGEPAVDCSSSSSSNKTVTTKQLISGGRASSRGYEYCQEDANGTMEVHQWIHTWVEAAGVGAVEDQAGGWEGAAEEGAGAEMETGEGAEEVVGGKVVGGDGPGEEAPAGGWVGWAKAVRGWESWAVGGAAKVGGGWAGAEMETETEAEGGWVLGG